MKKSEIIRARVQPELKDSVEEIFRKLGLTTTQAITLFYTQVQLRGGLPFDVAIPNRKTIKTFTATDEGRDLIICEDVEDMFGKLGL